MVDCGGLGGVALCRTGNGGRWDMARVCLGDALRRRDLGRASRNVDLAKGSIVVLWAV